MECLTTTSRDAKQPTEGTRIFNRTNGSIEEFKSKQWRSVTDGSPVLGYLTTTQRDALAAPTTGMLIYNETANEWQTYDGSSWTSLVVSSAATLCARWYSQSISTSAFATRMYQQAAQSYASEAVYLPSETTILKVVGALDSDSSEPTAMSIRVFSRNAAGTETSLVEQSDIAVTYSIAGVGVTAPTKIFVVTASPTATAAAGTTLGVKVDRTGGTSNEGYVWVWYSMASV